MENLKLSFVKPLAFIKVQTTGLNSAQDRIVELSITRIEVDGKTKTGTRLVNPTVEITEEVTKINGITNEKVKSSPTFKDIASKMNEFLDGCDFIGFNIGNFDLKFLSEEFNRAGIEFTLLGRKVVDLASVYHAMEPRDLASAYSLYCGKTMEKNSNSQNTVEMYSEIMNGMISKYSGKQFEDKAGKTQTVEATVDSINDLFNKNKKQLDLSGFVVLNENGRPVFSTGKYGPKDGVPAQLVSESLLKDREYYDWLINVSKFSPDTKLVLKKIFTKAEAASLVK